MVGEGEQEKEEQDKEKIQEGEHDEQETVHAKGVGHEEREQNRRNLKVVRNKKGSKKIP